MKTNSPNSGFFNPRIFAAFVLCSVGALLALFSFQSFATPTPASDTLTPTHSTITYTDTIVENTTGVVGAPICVAPNTCSDFRLTVNAHSVAATKQIMITGAWTPAQNDFDMYIEGDNAGTADGNVIAQNSSTANPSVILLPIPADGTVYHIFILASIGAGNLNVSIQLVDIPSPVNQGPGAPPRYINYVSPPGGAEQSGEPSIGVDWNPNVASLKHDLVNTGGVAFFTANLNQYRVDFDDCSSPAIAPWTDATFAPETLNTLDPIGFTDHYTTAQLGLSYPPPHTPGRTFQAQLTDGDSVTAFTDDDGATHTPSQGGGVPQGPDHETLGGGPFHSPIPTPPAPAYPNAIYYCTQSLTEAECSRSDNGGLTFGPGVPIFNPTVCLGGIHGHVKVSPQGTVYVPNSSCFSGSPGGNNGAARSTDNGITWNQFTVSGSDGSQDPSIGIGQNSVGKPSGQVPNTIYLGWVSADGHAHAAHSGDEGATWQNDIDVGSILGVQNAAFPVMVAGDDNRAAYSFIGTTTGGIGAYADPNFQGVWHLYIAHTYDGGQHWILIDATPVDPVQKGEVCLLGLSCSSAQRGLLDFNDITVDAQGRALVAYADGCVNCNNTFDGQSSQSRGTIARQSGGRRLFAAFDPVEPAPPAAPQVLSAARTSGPPAGVLVSWLTPDNGGSPITGYRVYRGTSSGTETFLASVSGVDTNKYLDQTANTATNYYYRVTAVNMINNATVEGAFCREVNVNGTAAAATACLAPFLTEGGAGIPGTPPSGLPTDPTMGQLTLQRIAMGEPFTTCTDKSITFVMKVANLNPTPAANGVWRFFFRARDTAGTLRELFVQMDTTFTPTPSFNYGYRDPIGTGSSTTQCFLSPTLTTCPVTGSSTPDGTIVMKLDVSQRLDFFSSTNTTTTPDFSVNIPVGTNFTNIAGETDILLGAGGTGSLRIVQTDGGTGTYTTIGNVAGCNATAPLAILTGSPLSGSPGLNVSFDGRGSFEPFGACGAINSYTLDFGDGSPAATNSTGTFTHTYNNPGTYPARLTVSDTIGHVSTNLAQVVITVNGGIPPLNGVVSRKTHGSLTPPPVGPGDLVLNTDPTAVTTIEPRAGGNPNGNQTLVFSFVNTLNGVTSVSATANGTTIPQTNITGSLQTDTHLYKVDLTGVPNASHLSVTLHGVTDSALNSGDITQKMDVLLGDVNGSGRVDGTDVSLVRQQNFQTVNNNAGTSNFLDDINASGRIDGTDVSIARQQNFTVLPSPP